MASCSAPVQITNSVGKCGSANLQANLSTAPTSGLCNVGTASTVRGNGPWTWLCQVSNEPSDVCLAAPAGIEIVDMSHANLLNVKNAIASANTLFNSPNSSQQNTTVILKFPAGTYDFSNDTSVNNPVQCTQVGNCPQTNSFDFSNTNPGPKGRLVIMGAGTDQTTFITNPSQTQFFTKNTSRLTIIGLHETMDRYDTSQGYVVNPQGNTYPPNVVVVDLDAGFPSLQTFPAGIFNPRTCGPGVGKYLRKYNSDGTICHIDYLSPISQQPFSNAQLMPEAGHPNRWWFTLQNCNGVALPNPFADGDLIGVKSELGAGGGPYNINLTTDLIFDHLLWTRRSRGAFAYNSGFTGYIHIYDSSILTESPINGQPICMATSGGGPQIGQPGATNTWGNEVDGLYAENTGDDSIAVFNSFNPDMTLGTTISNSFITDSFARSINLNNSPYPVPNNVIRVRTHWL
jgi:hypothetical protein